MVMNLDVSIKRKVVLEELRNCQLLNRTIFHGVSWLVDLLVV